jgi:hypothetical protein
VQRTRAEPGTTRPESRLSFASLISDQAGDKSLKRLDANMRASYAVRGWPREAGFHADVVEPVNLVALGLLLTELGAGSA